MYVDLLLINIIVLINMDLFKNIIQPTIVHLGDYENINIANKYFLNYN